MRKRILCALLVCCMIAGLLPAFGTAAWAASETNAPSGYTPIYTASDLDAVRNDLSGSYILMNDIDLASWGDWKPIGGRNVKTGFKGVFDGNGHSILNMVITDDTVVNNSASGATDYAGLFSVLNGATVKNISTISGSISTKEQACMAIGAIAGQSVDSSIFRCASYVNITYRYGEADGENIIGSTMGIAFEGGGIVGDADSGTSVRECANHGSIAGFSDSAPMRIGGIAGQHSSDTGNEILDCFNSGTLSAQTDNSSSYVGGIAGQVFGNWETMTISNCYNIGSVYCKAGQYSGSYIGAIHGCIPSWSYKISLTNCYYLAGVPAIGHIYPLINDHGITYVHTDTTACSSYQMLLPSTFSGFDFKNIWQMGDANYPYPVLKHVGINIDLITKTSTTVNGTNPKVSKVYITNILNNRATLGQIDSTSAIFNKEIKKGTGLIKLIDMQSGLVVYALPVTDDRFSASGNVFLVDLKGLNLKLNHSYYINIDSGAILAQDGTPYYGLFDDSTWTFSVAPDVSDESTDVTLSWAKKETKSLFRRWSEFDDRSKPPIPVGTNKEYANALVKWATQSGISLTYAEAFAMLNKPMPIPVTDVNGSSLLLEDGTTIGQVVEDLIFIEYLQPYITTFDAELAEAAKSGKLLKAETEVCKEVFSWYEQIDRYLQNRGDGSTSSALLSSAAPVAYVALTEILSGSESYQFIKPLLTATLDKAVLEATLTSMSTASDFEEFEERVSELSTAVRTGKSLYQAYSGDGYGSTISLGADLFVKYLGSSGNQTLADMANAYAQFDSFTSAVKTSMAVGCSLGMLPLVVDLQNMLNSKLSNQVIASYFIGDYYIYRNYPALYNYVFGNGKSLYPTTDFSYDPDNNIVYAPPSVQEDYFERNSDSLLYKWTDFVDMNVDDYDSFNVKLPLRRELSNLAMILNFARDLDLIKTREGLCRYISAMNNQRNTTKIYGSCPVTIRVYDMNGSLLASLSSEDENIQNCPYGSLYLLGEDKETKCFVFDADAYRVEIVPYDEGTMDLAIIRSMDDGTKDTKYFDDVPLTVGGVYTIDTETGTTLTGSGSINSTVSMAKSVPVSKILIQGEAKPVVGSSFAPEVQFLPAAASDTVTWSSSDESIVSISKYSGTAKAVAAGTAVITATSKSGVIGTFTVSPYVPTEVLALDSDKLSMLCGETYTLTASVTEGATNPVVWRSEDPSVAIVDDDGTITALKQGKTVIAATVDGLTAYTDISVSEAPLSVSLYQSDTNGMRLKIDLENASSQIDFSGYICVALYADSKMYDVLYVPLELAACGSQTEYFSLTNFPNAASYTASAFVLDEYFQPSQCKVSTELLA